MVRCKILFFISFYASRCIVFYENSVDGTEPSMKIDVSFIGAFGELKYENFHYLLSVLLYQHTNDQKNWWFYAMRDSWN